MNDEQKPEPPIFTGPSAQFDIDALLDKMRRDRKDKEQQDGKHLR